MILDESLFENEVVVNEQTMTQRDAMDKCISLGNQFIEHFDKIYNGKNEDTNKRHAQEMQDCLEQVNRIKLTHNNRFIPFDKKIGWFFTAGSDADTLFNDVREAERFEDFLALVAVNNDVIKSLKSLGMLKDTISEDVSISTDEAEEKTIEPEDNGISMIINNLIKDEYEAIDGYNSAITTFKGIGKSDEAISVLNDIVAEENIHVGQLQRLMELFDPNADKVSDGVEEADEQIDNSLDMSDEEFLEKFAEWYDPTKGNSSNYDTSAIPNYSNPVNESAGNDNIVDMSCSNCTDDADEDEFLKGFENLMNR